MKPGLVGFAALLIFYVETGAAAEFSLGNLLVTHNNALHEYTIDGSLVQSIPVPHPDTMRYEAADVVLDAGGNAHVVNYAPFSNSYISTYDPTVNAWTHTPASVGFGNVSDGDLSILGDTVFRRGVRMDVNTFEVELFDIGMFNGPSETSGGADHLLYSINSGSPRYRVQRTDPVSLGNIGSEFELRDAAGIRLDGRGLAITPSGHIYVAEWDGRIYRYDAHANFIESHLTGANNLLDLNLRHDGKLVTGSRFGSVVITDVEFNVTTTFTVGSGLVYVAFATPPFAIPEPSTAALITFTALVLLRFDRRSCHFTRRFKRRC